VLVIHPDYLYACLSEQQFTDYVAKREHRQVMTYRHYHEMLTSTAPLVRVKNAAPYSDALQSIVYLNPSARASYNASKDTYEFSSKSFKHEASAETLDVSQTIQLAMQELTDKQVKGLGVDVQLLSEISTDNQAFIQRNFTDKEIAFCEASADPRSSFAARWAAKEAVIKSIGNATSSAVWKSAGAPLKDIEIERVDGQAPRVILHGDAQAVAKQAGVQFVKVTMSHSGSYAVAAAVSA
jgi:phosphopantetheine--protein transferase-like protein